VLKERVKHHDAIAAQRSMRECGSQQVCESHFLLQRTIETDAGARQPWLGRSFAKARNQYERGDGDHEEEEEKWWRHEKWLELMARSLFNSGGNEGSSNCPLI
jgi:hypothetical protein